MVPAIVRAYRERFPGVALTPEQSLMQRLFSALNSGEIDIAFVRTASSDGDRLGIELLVEEPMLAIVPASHRLAGERSLALAALAEDTFIIFPREYGPVLYDAVVASCQRAGFTPRLDQAQAIARWPSRTDLSVQQICANGRQSLIEPAARSNTTANAWVSADTFAST